MSKCFIANFHFNLVKLIVGIFLLLTLSQDVRASEGIMKKYSWIDYCLLL